MPSCLSGHALKLALVSALKAVTHHDFVSLSNQIVSRKMKVREGRAEAADELPVLVSSVQISSRIVPYKIQGKEVVELVQVPLVPDLFPYLVSQ